MMSGVVRLRQVEGVRFLWQRAMDGRAGGENRGGLGSLMALEDGDKVKRWGRGDQRCG